jgi:alpha-ribazole phosphatase
LSLWLIRHPRPAVPAGTCYGATDVPIEDAHLAQLLDELPSLLPAGAPLYSSPASRCLRLARGLERLGWAPLTTDPRLREMDFGEWEGHPWSALPRAEVDAWRADIADYAPPGGESVRALAARGLDFCETLAPGRDTIVVTHAGVIQTLLRTLRGLPLTDFGGRRIEYGELVRIDLGGR